MFKRRLQAQGSEDMEALMDLFGSTEAHTEAFKYNPRLPMPVGSLVAKEATLPTLCGGEGEGGGRDGGGGAGQPGKLLRGVELQGEAVGSSGTPSETNRRVCFYINNICAGGAGSLKLPEVYYRSRASIDVSPQLCSVFLTSLCKLFYHQFAFCRLRKSADSF